MIRFHRVCTCLRTPALLPALIAMAFGLMSGACAIPHGSLARPVNPVEEGGAMIAVGGLVPFAAAGRGNFGDDVDFAGIAENFVLIPAASFDYALGTRNYLGLEVSVLNTLTTPSDDFFGVFVNPRWELGLSEFFSVTVDGNLGFVTADGTTDPFVTPTFGTRLYVPTGFGGLIWSQQVSTSFITLTLPGSLSYDVPLSLGESSYLHIFPEVRYDPSILFLGDNSGIITFFSGGLTFMLEL